MSEKKVKMYEGIRVEIKNTDKPNPVAEMFLTVLNTLAARDDKRKQEAEKWKHKKNSSSV